MPKRRKDEPAEPVEENEDEEDWDVEEILDHRVRRGVKEYKVLWLGYPIEQASWEPLDHLKLKQYQRKLEDDCKKQLRNRPIITTPAKSSSPKGRGAYIEDDSDEDNAPAKTPEREESSSSESSTEESTSEESPSDESVYETEPDEPSTSTAKPKKKKEKRDGSPKVRVVSFVRDGPLKRNPSSGQPLEIRKRPKTSTAGTPTSSKKPRLDVVNERSKDATPTRVQKNRPPSSRPIRPYVAPTQQRPATTASSSTKSALDPTGRTRRRPPVAHTPAPTTKQPTPKKTPRSGVPGHFERRGQPAAANRRILRVLDRQRCPNEPGWTKRSRSTAPMPELSDRKTAMNISF
ncbi:Chromo domain-containing protein [Aphelenchoides fujianensis]|nr:Chromo domain-containing protein [Aphelenchoides fujianensis]